MSRTDLERRVERLEAGLVEVGTSGCPDCGAGGSGPVTFRILGVNEPVPSEGCAACGARPFVFTLKLGERALREG